jgi:uncharacterized delta-60 repeat protein
LVNGTPAITSQPQNVLASIGATATFSVTATGSSPSYQWLFNGTNVLAGVTNSSCSITNVQPGNGGTYSVVVSNACGSTTSSNASLIVTIPYTFATLAGSTAYGSADGTGSAAGFYHPTGVAVDTNGNVYVADYANHTIRKVTPAGVVTTLAGLAGSFGTNDGTGSVARFYYPAGVAVDTNGNVYVADQNNHTIRQVTPAGVVTTLAGSAGASGTNDGTGVAARFSHPNGVAVYSNGSVYVADYSNDTIRQVTPVGTNWVVTTLAGLAGSAGSADGTGSAARFHYPAGVAVDTKGNVYVADQYNDTIRQVTPIGTNWVVTTLAGLAGSAGSADGTGSAARFAWPTGVAVDTNGNVYVADYLNDTIRKVAPVGTNWIVTTLAGLAGSAGSADGTGSTARFSNPSGAGVDATGNVYVADSANNTMRKGAVSVGPPVILLQPQSQAVTQGISVVFSVVATGTAPVSYQWWFNGSSVAGATAASYSLTSTQPTNAGSYSVVVTNSVGSVTSSTANLSVAVGATLSFASPAYSVTRSAGSALITVVRDNVTSSTASVNYATANGTAVAGVDYSSVSGTLTFSSNVTSAFFSVPILGGPTSGEKTVLLSLSNPSGDASLASPSSATLTILSPPVLLSQPQSQTVVWGGPAVLTVTASGTAPLYYQWSQDGASIAGATNTALSLDPAQFSDAGTYAVMVSNTFGSVVSSNAVLTVNSPQGGDVDFSFNPGSINGTVVSVAAQPDGKALIGGYFTTVNGVSRNGIARLNADGSLDTGFQNGLAGANGPVFWVAVQSDGRVLVGGEFTTVNGVSRNNIARLNTDGSLDPGFQNGLAGANGSVFCVAAQSDGRVLVGGDFTTVNGVSRNNIARLNADGSLDNGFQNGLAGANSFVNAVTMQSNGAVLVGGNFTTVNGVSRNYIARLNADGSLDTGFLNGLAGANNYVYAIAVQSNGAVLAGGNFTTVNGVGRNYIARLNADGSLDPGFLNGLAGPNSYVFSLAVQSGGKVLIGGDFTTVNGVGRNYIARLNGDGSLDTGFQNGLAGANSDVFSVAAQPDDEVLIGGPFTAVNGTPAFYVARLYGDLPGAPLILLQPQSQTVIAGGSTTLSVTASGIAPLSYQWRFNGTNLSAATASAYTISNAQPSQAGSYSVLVTNVLGGTLSSNAVLTVDTTVRLSLAVATTNGFQFRLTGPVGIYVIQASTNLLNWAPIATNATTSAGVLCFTDPNASKYARRYYRAASTVLATVQLDSAGFTMNGFAFRLLGPPGTYVIQASTNLMNWAPVATNSTSTGLWNYTDPGATGVGRRFYRVLLQ